jgi:hypothetical protein
LAKPFNFTSKGGVLMMAFWPWPQGAHFMIFDQCGSVGVDD